MAKRSVFIIISTFSLLLLFYINIYYYTSQSEDKKQTSQTLPQYYNISSTPQDSPIDIEMKKMTFITNSKFSSNFQMPRDCIKRSNDSSKYVLIQFYSPKFITLYKQSQFPQIFLQTFEFSTIPKRMALNILKIDEYYPEYERYYFNATNRLNFLLSLNVGNLISPFFHVENVIQHLSKIADDLQLAGVVLAEIFRYTSIYVRGGAYFDVDVKWHRKIDFMNIINKYIILKINEEFNIDYRNNVNNLNIAIFSYGNMETQRLSQWGYWSTPKHILFSAILRRAQDKILSAKEIPKRIDQFVSMELLAERAATLFLKNGASFKPSGLYMHVGSGGIHYFLYILPTNKGPHFDGAVDFKYGGYEKDLKLCGVRHWHYGWGR